VIVARKSTPEMPLTVIDHIADLERCRSLTDIQQFSQQLPIEVLNDERYNRAVASRLAAIKERKAAA
jgi:hypothetical protein